MLRSLSSSITGLKNHQVAMDLIGNNIANVNTTGYKSQRVTFSESFSQMLRGSTKPSEGGGTNPLQVGLGMNVGSIDTILTQGNLQSTGQVTDLAVEGDGYFSVSNGEGNFYTRNGSFQMDSDGNLVLPTNGYILQGKLASSDGSFPVGTTIGDVRIPFNEQSPANATTQVSFSRNLDADSGARGTVVYSQKFLAASVGTDDLSALTNSKGVELGIKEGDNLTFYAEDALGNGYTGSYTVNSGDDLDTLATQMQNFLRLNIDGSTVVQPDATTLGALTVGSNSGSAIMNLQVTSDNPLSNSTLNKALNFPTTISAGTILGSVITDALRSPAEATDELQNLYDSSGDAVSNALTGGDGLEDGDTIQISGAVGGEGVTASSLTYHDSNTPGSETTLQDLLDYIKDSLKLPVRDGTVQDNLSVSMNSATSDDGIPDGTIVIRGAKGLDFQLTNISVKGDNADNDANTTKLFNANLSFSEFQKAQDTGVFDSSITIYDESGDSHILTMTFIHTGVPNEWNWEVSASGDEQIVSGSSGTMEFGRDGTVAAFSYADGSTELTLDPINGSEIMHVGLDVGGPKNFQGITQFSAPSTVSAVSQDGFPTGSLQEISIDEEGVLTGSFSNGVSKALAQIMLVEFTNPGGLQQVSDSVFSTSSNSGDPVYTIPGTSSRIKPAALEMSNVDLAREFTSMITTQRGYQANARVITVSDSMLEELVSLKR